MASPTDHVKIAERVSTRLKLKQLRLLVTIDKHRSILHAAGELNMSQPAATKLLKDLEADFNVQLFDRTNRGVIPTHFGEALIRHGKLILAQISHAAQELDDLVDGLGGRVVVGTLLTASAVLLPNTITKVHNTRPNVSIIVRDGTNDFLMPKLHNGDLDLVVGRLAEYRYRDEFHQEVLYQEPVVLVCRKNNPVLSIRKLTFENLANCNWILPPTETTLRRQVEKEFFDRGLPAPQNPIECVSYLTNRALLTGSDLIGVLPLQVVESEVDRGELVIIPVELNIASGPVGVSYRNRDALSPAASEFLNELRNQATRIAETWSK